MGTLTIVLGNGDDSSPSSGLVAMDSSSVPECDDVGGGSIDDDDDIASVVVVDFSACKTMELEEPKVLPPVEEGMLQ